MTLKEKIAEDLKEAMKAKNQSALTALRELKSLILLEETKEGGSGTLTESDEISLITKAIKQRRESFEMFHGQGRTQQAEEQKMVIEVMEKYLPRQLSQEELEAKIQEIIATTGASSIKDMGKVMGLATGQLAGQAEGKVISETVKRLLS